MDFTFGFSQATDFEKWLESRKDCVTATESHDVAAGRFAAVLERKGKRIPDNKYMKHGRDREPVIAAAAAVGMVSEDYSLAPNSALLHNKFEPRFAATPDLLGTDDEGRTIIGEIKTVAEHRDWGDDDLPTNYYSQIQWSMFVTGAHWCFFVWEPYAEREDGSLAPTVMEPYSRWVEADPGLQEEMAAAAHKFLEWREDPSDTSHLGDLVNELASRMEFLEAVQADVDQQKALVLKELTAGPGSHKTARLTVSAVSRSRDVVDQDLIEAADPARVFEYGAARDLLEQAKQAVKRAESPFIVKVESEPTLTVRKAK